jgi:hypothetical protein
MDPLDRATPPQRFRQAVQAVADNPVNALDAGLLECRQKEVGYIVDCHGISPKIRNRRAQTA